jgi:ribosomal protein S18 acetylase RimI-like enzyme
VNIRLATPSDAPALAQLRYDFRAAEHPPVEPEAEFVARCAAWMSARLEPGAAWRCWLLEDEAGTIVGNLWLQPIEKLPNPGPEPESHAYITNVYVAPAARGHAAGELLVSTAMTFCRDNDVDSAILWPTARSRTLYARHGVAVRDDLLEAIVTPGRE